MVCRQTKITYFYVVVGIQKNVDRLQIPVDHSLMGESKETKFNLFPSYFAWETLAFLHSVKLYQHLQVPTHFHEDFHGNANTSTLNPQHTQNVLNVHLLHDHAPLPNGILIMHLFQVL